MNYKMQTTITKKWLKSRNACGEGIEWFKQQKDKSTINIIKKLKKENKNDWLNWLLIRLMNYKQYVSYAVYAAEQVIDIYEKKYPNDGRPRDAIEAAKRCIESPTKKNKAAAAATIYAAYEAVDAAATYAAYEAVDAAVAAAAAATATAATAAYEAAATYATYAADAATAAYEAAAAKMKLKIINYGIRILRSIL